MRDVAKLWSAGYALGASFENTVVVTEDRVLNPEGLRFPDEFVRHKVLDAVGDLPWRGRRCSAPIVGARRPQAQPRGAAALMADPPPGRVVEASKPSRRIPRGHADVGDRAGGCPPMDRTSPRTCHSCGDSEVRIIALPFDFEMRTSEPKPH